MRYQNCTTSLLILMAATIGACSATSPTGTRLSASATALPFKGTVKAVETSDYQEATNSARIHLEGTGNATQLGSFTVVTDFTLDLVTLRGVQTSTLTAANGDALKATVQAQGIDNGDGGVTLRTVETATITGGTGRFAGATGNYVMQRVLVEETGVSSGTLEGTITLKK